MTSIKLLHGHSFLMRLKLAFSIYFLINACGYDFKSKANNVAPIQ